MAGLLDGVLPWAFSTGNTIKRNVKGLLQDPKAFAGSIAQDLQHQQGERNKALNALLSPGVFQTPQEKAAANNTLANEAMNLLGITVYHGSPHKFNKFDSSKIGTGEGNQSYSHGLYFADLKDTAQTYKSSAPFVGRHVQQIGLDALNKSGGDVAKARTLLHEQYKANTDPYLRQPLADAVNNIADIASGNTGGYLYKVDLPDSAVAKMLDWDKPLSQQAPEVQKFFEPMISKTRAELSQPAPGWGEFSSPQVFDPTGQELLALLRDSKLSPDTIFKNGLDSSVSRRLHSAGIPGIRYLDQGSRFTPQAHIEFSQHLDGSPRFSVNGPKGDMHFSTMKEAQDYIESLRTRNYVVFPGGEGMLRILERNGQGLLGQ